MVVDEAMREGNDWVVEVEEELLAEGEEKMAISKRRRWRRRWPLASGEKWRRPTLVGFCMK